YVPDQRRANRLESGSAPALGRRNRGPDARAYSKSPAQSRASLRLEGVPTMSPARTLFQKPWDTHRVAAEDDEHDLIYIDRQLLYEVTSPQAFESLRLAGRHVRRPETALTTVDHNVHTRRRNQRLEDPLAQAQIDQMEINSREFGLRY